MPKLKPANLGRYFVLSQQPLQILAFLLPLIVAYELGTWRYVQDPSTGAVSSIQITAYQQLNSFFELFGIPAAGWYLPGLALIAVLIVLHVIQRHSWTVHLGIPLVMFIEAVALAIPLLVLDKFIGMLMGPDGLLHFTGAMGATAAFSTAPPTDTAGAAMQAETLGQMAWQTRLVLSIGAGIYEELLFRMVIMLAMHTLCVSLFKWSQRTATIVAVVGSSLAFMVYHPAWYSGDGGFMLYLAVFYFLCGVYFAVLYASRGFGIVAGTHAAYDIIVIVVIPWLGKVMG
ncbi:MAG: CPBP family intramembrane metalloprotease [Planctomycetes bacterium]|nr:CPBP family intramembrane metalloprotease [Planctomycetota bacterium]NOG55217.1 CPBP family intramembrane metalloprotease [Planctomycetota bacterium]